jgi:hypothetical protein
LIHCQDCECHYLAPSSGIDPVDQSQQWIKLGREAPRYTEEVVEKFIETGNFWISSSEQKSKESRIRGEMQPDK